MLQHYCCCLLKQLLLRVSLVFLHPMLFARLLFAVAKLLLLVAVAGVTVCSR